MENYEPKDTYEELSGEYPSYKDTECPQLAFAATRALRVSLDRSVESACTVQDFWEVFQNFVRRYEHGIFIESLVDGLKNDIREALILEKTSEIRAEILAELRDEIRKECEATIFEDVSQELREEVEEQVRAKLIREEEPALRQELRAQIIDEIRPQVEVKLRGELIVSADFIASVKADLQRKILGL